MGCLKGQAGRRSRIQSKAIKDFLTGITFVVAKNPVL